MKTVAIIGGGFSGTLVAVNLCRFSEAPLRVMLINKGRPLGRGIAYSTKRGEHLLNVAARNMSALADHPDHFVDWLRTRTEYADAAENVLRETFVPRRVYGDYLRSLLQSYAVPVHGHAQAQIEFVADEAVDLVASDDDTATVMLASGDEIQADKVVLATGNLEPSRFGTPEGAPFEHPRYVAQPWGEWETLVPDPHEDVVLLGTGLTAIDAFLTLSTMGHRGTIFAVSRSGELPQSHFRGIEYPDFPPGDPTTLGLAGMVELLETHCGRLRNLGAHPAIVIDKLRPHTQKIWKSFTNEEKREFLTRYLSRWNTLRHRVAPEIHRQLMLAIDDRRFQIVHGRIVGLQSAGSRIKVVVADDSGTRLHIEGGFVLNCTGPSANFSQGAPVLFRNLAQRGLIEFDDLDMGLKVDADYSLIDRGGETSEWLSALGPLLRGMLFETTAVPELRVQSLQLAQRLINDLSLVELPLARPHAEFYPEVIEYCI